MNREEILDMARDILDNTDATLEEAMGIAIESAENKMSDAEKYRRRRLKAIGAANASARPGKYEGLSHEARYKYKDKTGNYHYDSGPNPSLGAELSKRDRALLGAKGGYSNMSKAQKFKADISSEIQKNKISNDTFKKRHAYVNENPKFSKFDRHRYENSDGKVVMNDYKGLRDASNAAHAKRAAKASKEAAIMDTALDFLDMYDVSLEEAIDMAYDYLIG